MLLAPKLRRTKAANVTKFLSISFRQKHRGRRNTAPAVNTPHQLPRAYGFPFHEACWVILTDRSPVDNRNIQMLLDICLSASIHHGLPTVLDWGHDYGGYASCSLVADDIGLGLKHRRLEFFSNTQRPEFYNPVHDVWLSQYLEKFFGRNKENRFFPYHGRWPCRPLLRRTQPSTTIPARRSPFSVLPAELLQMILEYLPISDALAVRQASREFASLGLHDLFWRSRFLPGRELGYVFEVMPYFSRLPGTWRLLFTCVKRLVNSPEMRNRRRVLGLSTSLQDLMRQAGHTPCEGHQKSSFIQSHFPMSWISASWFKDMSWSLHDRRVVIPDDVTAIFVSTVEVFGRRYVSGIRMDQGSKRDNAIILGYRHAQHETLLLRDEQGLRIAGFHLAFDRDAVRGIAAITASGAVSDWVGEHDKLPKRRLVPSSHGKDVVKALSGGFDAFRLLVLSISAGADGKQLKSARRTPRDSVMWYPDIPEPYFCFRGLAYPFEDSPISMVIFGGNRGQDLRYITCLSVWLRLSSFDGFNYPLALEVTFSDRRQPVRLACSSRINSWMKIDFPIDGPGGERITGISRRLLKDPKWCGFWVRTNRGRVGIFPPSPDGEKVRRSVLSGSTGKTIIGFWRVTSRLSLDPEAVYI